MKKTIILSIVMLVALNMFAANRSRSEMLSIAASALSTDCATGRVLRAHSRVEPILESETPQYAIYSDEVGGFVIVSKRDDVRPVLGRSLGKYDAANIPDGLQWWLNATSAALRAGATTSDDADILKVNETIDNFVAAKWGQGSPYNLYCPKDNNDKRCVTGCVATAMAMAMNYFKYPDAGTGMGWYSVTTEVEGAKPDIDTIYNVPIDGQYKWDNMKDTYAPNALAKNLATLMYDCGKSIGMEYSANQSAAYQNQVAYALAYNFGYDSLSVNYFNRSYLSNKEWYTIVRNELENRRPIIYGGQDDEDGGHTFIVTGINTDGMVYVNWGWDGYCNGWFAIDHLYIENIGADFSSGQEMTVGLNPQKTPAEGLENTSRFFFAPDVNFSLSSDESNDVFIDDFIIYNLSWRLFQGDIRMVIETEEEKPDLYTLSFNYPDKRFYIKGFWGISFYGFNIAQDFQKEGEDAFKFPKGFYRVYFQTKSLEESDWQLVEKPGGKAYCYFSVAADGTVKVDNENSLSGIHDVIYSPASNAPTAIYSIDGRKIDSSSSSNVVIMKNGKDVRKVINVNR
ncbi:MAG: C10 family peptidase [Prevotellaceae bacterium]|nr:C10 family peptidase [Prevotellaceae bacterium]